MSEISFNNEIVVHEQSVRGIHYSTLFDEDFDFNDFENLTFSCNYEVFTHKEKKRDHLIVLELGITPKHNKSDREGANQFHIIVEGHYEVRDSVEEELIEEAKHFGSLSNLLGFLRTSVYNISSMTKSGKFNLPLIQITQLHENYNRIRKKTRNKSK